MLYFVFVPYDLTEGRGWQTPSAVTDNQETALWLAFHHRPFYGRPQDVYVLEPGEEMRFDKAHSFVQEGKLTDPELNAFWQQRLAQLSAAGEPLPQPKLDPYDVYLTGPSEMRYVGSTKYNDRFVFERVYLGFDEAVNAVSEEIAPGERRHVVKLRTDTYYLNQALEEERIFTVVGE
jgi:hypothetical protein